MSRSGTRNPSSESPRILVSLLSTRAAANRGDKLRDASAAAAWLADQGLSSSDLEVTEAERQRLLDLREGLYTLLLAPRRRWTGKAARLFNQTIRDAPLEVSVTQNRTIRLESPDRTFEGAFGKIVSLVVESYFADRWSRIKACADDKCQRVFYDDSRNANRKWCDGRCGDRVRTRNHRSARRHGRL